MNDLIRTVLAYAVVMAIIIGCAKFYKTQNKVKIDPSDSSMDIGYGNFSLDTSILGVSDLNAGELVAFYVPGKPESCRVARVVALEGQHVEVTQGAVKVNGKPSVKFPAMKAFNVPEVRIPRGCVYLLADKPAETEDSFKVGPVPFSSLKGRVKQ